MLVSQQHSSKKHEPRLKKARPVFGLYCLLAGGGRRGVTGLLLGLHVLICKINEASIQLLQHSIWWQRQCETFLPSPLKVLSNYSVSWSNSRAHRVSDHRDKARVSRECCVLSIKDHQTRTILTRKAPAVFCLLSGVKQKLESELTPNLLTCCCLALLTCAYSHHFLFKE